MVIAVVVVKVGVAQHLAVFVQKLGRQVAVEAEMCPVLRRRVPVALAADDHVAAVVRAVVHGVLEVAAKLVALG